MSYVIKRRMQLDSYLELPEEKRPPRNLWDKPSELKEWFDMVYSGGKKQTEFNIPSFSDNEIEE